MHDVAWSWPLGDVLVSAINVAIASCRRVSTWRRKTNCWSIRRLAADVNPSVFAVRLHHTFGIFWHLSTIWSSWILLFDTLYLFSYCHLLFSFWREEPRHSCLLFDYQRLSWFFRSTSCITVRWSSESLSCLDLLPQWKVTISEAKPSCKGKFAPQSLIIMSGLSKAQQVGGWLESSWSLKHLEVFKWAKCI